MMIERNYKHLEDKVLEIPNIVIKTKVGEKVTLMRGIDEGKDHLVSILMPWGNIYDLKKFDSEKEAKDYLGECENALKNGGYITIKNGWTAELECYKK